MSRPFHFFGIRHHGPACARSLLDSLGALAPDCILIEGPPDAAAILPFAQQQAMVPPVAILVYAQDNLQQAAFYPFAEFSPEWQAIQYALQKGVELRFIDLPCAYRFALSQNNDHHSESASENDSNSEIPNADANATPTVNPLHYDPLSYLAQAAGYEDGEGWWNQLIEEQAHDHQIFDAVNEAMSALREAESEFTTDYVPDSVNALREAHMRLSMAEAEKAGFSRIAVVCGAWHVPALNQSISQKHDKDLLKSLAKLKTQATWVPWTYQRISRDSGYGAGVVSPQWYAHLWQYAADPQRNVRWLAKVAAVFRQHDIDCSSAHMIETARLADTLAVMRLRQQAGLQELLQALQTVVCMGDSTPLKLVENALMVGYVMGAIPPDAPMVPLQQDLEQQQKSLRLKPEALPKILELDLRKPQDLAKSELLHRLNLLGIPWGTLTSQSKRARGTFHENWQLQWQPELVITLIERSTYGATLAQAASQYLISQAQSESQVTSLAEQIASCLWANLPQAVQQITVRLAEVAAIASDILQFIGAIPPLVNIVRYGNVRNTDSSQVAQVIEHMLIRVEVGLVGACANLDDEAAARIYRELKQLQHALQSLFQDYPDWQADWQACLQHLAYLGQTHRQLSGLATRFLFDDQILNNQQLANHMQLALSAGHQPLQIAQWLEGFLSDNATVLTHHDTLWQLLDQWLQHLDDDSFISVLPLLRRAFGSFNPSERYQLGQRAHTGKTVIGNTMALELQGLDIQRANLVLPLMAKIMGKELAS